MSWMSGTDVIISVVFCLMLLVIGAVQARALGVRFEMMLLFVATSIAFAYVRYQMELEVPSDASFYYTMGIAGTPFSLGTDGISYLTGLFSLGLNLGFLPTMIAFTAFGLLALQLFYAAFMRYGGARLPFLARLGVTVMLVTSVGFWSAGISKEGIALLGIALLCWGLARDRGRVVPLALAVAMMTLARPHVGLMMLFSIGLGFLAGADAKPAERFFVIVAGSFVVVVLLPLVLVYTGLANLISFDQLGSTIEERALGFSDTGGFVDITELPLPLKMLSYLFRPLPWEAGSVIQLAAALQNVALLAGTLLALPSLFRRVSGGSLRTVRNLSLLCFGLTCLLFTALTTANAGISTRQKWMCVLPLFFVLLHAWLNKHRRGAALVKRDPPEAVHPEPEVPSRT